MREDFERLARDLAGAWVKGTAIPLPLAGQGPTTRAEAYAIQDRMAELIGQPVAGWKFGATVRAVQIFEGHDGPTVGRILADRVFSTPARVPASLFAGVKAECEFGFKTTRELPAGRLDAAAIAGCLDFHPAIELAGSHYAPGTGQRAANTFDGIADNGTGGAAVLAPAVADWQRLPFETLEIDARIDDSPPIQAYSGAYRRNPVEIAAECFNDLRARGVQLPVGTILLTGSLTLPTMIRAGQTLSVRYAGLPPFQLTMV